MNTLYMTYFLKKSRFFCVPLFCCLPAAGTTCVRPRVSLIEKERMRTNLRYRRLQTVEWEEEDDETTTTNEASTRTTASTTTWGRGHAAPVGVGRRGGAVPTR